MSANSASPLQDLAAFKDQVRRHCEQRYAGGLAGSPLLGKRPIPGRSQHHHYQHQGEESFVVGSPELHRSSDGQLRPRVADSGPFGESQPIKIHPHLKIKVSEVRRSNDDSQHQPMFAEGNDQFIGPSTRMIPPHTNQRNYSGDNPFSDEIGRSGDNNQSQQMVFAGNDPFGRPPPTYAMISKHIHQQNAEDEVTVSQGEFRVDLNVAGYAPEELDVKIVGNDIAIRGSRHAESHTGEFANVSQAFNRRYALPDNILVDGVSVFLARSGMLSVRVPRKTAVVEEQNIAQRQIKVKFQDEQ